MFQDLGDCFADHTEIQTSTVLAGGWTVGSRKRVGGDSKGPSRHGATWKASFGGSVGRRNSHRQRGEWVGFRGMSRSPSAEGREEGPGAGTGSEARAGPEAAEAKPREQEGWARAPSFSEHGAPLPRPQTPRQDAMRAMTAVAMSSEDAERPCPAPCLGSTSRTHGLRPSEDEAENAARRLRLRRG